MQQRSEETLDRLLPAATIAPQRLHQAMRYATLGAGKRVRPLLCHAAGALSKAEPQRLDNAAAALELIHVYSLVHDDLPCMDDDVLRRGKPTCHVEFDEATALLVGDALQSLAFQVLAEQPSGNNEHTAARQLEMLYLLAQAAGSRGMAGGQAIDLAAVDQQLSLAELEFMHIHKTGALIRAAVLLGATCGKPLTDEARRHLDHYAKIIGLLFQVIDDILDSEADTATLGKTAGKDAAHNKPTYVSLLGLSQAKAKAAELRGEAHAALSSFGDAARRLTELTDYICDRRF
ncbi:polyprenyl synthetase family protein [Sterolibacterium denitrificans]|nr:farnesyl diphosphate synthase [Sterolibacterium denitrificans]